LSGSAEFVTFWMKKKKNKYPQYNKVPLPFLWGSKYLTNHKTMSNTTAKKFLIFRGPVSQEKYFNKRVLISLIQIFIKKIFISIKTALDLGGGCRNIYPGFQLDSKKRILLKAKNHRCRLLI
jgi:hypothetical protein